MNNIAISVKLSAMMTMLTAGSLLAFASAASAVTLKITFDNISGDNATRLTPLWVGFHNGGFDIYDRGASLNLFPGTEALVEDGNNAPISDQFNIVAAGQVQGSLVGISGPNNEYFDIGETQSFLLEVDPTSPSSRYFSYASMIIPTNDAFIANDNPLEHRIFDDFGNFLGVDLLVLGSDVLDGGTEVNDEIPANTAFFGQSALNVGVEENGVVAPHPGFIPGGPILSDPRFANANFLTPGYQVARIRVELVTVPEPSTVVGLLAIGGAFFLKGRKKTK